MFSTKILPQKKLSENHVFFVAKKLQRLSNELQMNECGSPLAVFGQEHVDRNDDSWDWRWSVAPEPRDSTNKSGSNKSLAAFFPPSH